MEARLHWRPGSKACRTLGALAARVSQDPGRRRGQRFRRCTGYDLPVAATQRSTIGHSRVLKPRLREAELAHFVARRLLLKAVSRMRRMRYARARSNLASALWTAHPGVDIIVSRQAMTASCF